MSVRSSFRPAPFSGVGGSELLATISSWLRVGQSTVTGAGISSLPDVLNSNPAVQTTDALRPVLGNSANGLGLITGDSGKVLFLPLVSANNATSQWGMATHIRTPLSAAIRTVFGVRGGNGANLNRVNIKVEADESLHATVYIDDANNRAGSTPVSAIGNNTVQFLTVEFDGTQATESGKLTITLDGSVQSLSFLNEAGAGAMPATMVAAAGNGLIGAFNTAGGSSPFTGFIGPNIYFMGSKMSGATVGLLTSAARTALGDFERPT